ncbi:MAG: hypothetical protein ACAF41_09215 [Leptolyngbya sp. BL-A-14]
MKTTQIGAVALLGLGSVLFSLPALAAYPALYWWRQPVSYSVRGCFNQAEKAMKQEGLQGIEIGNSDVYGHTDESAVAITCFDSGGKTQVVIMVTGSDSAEVKELRETMKNAF